MLRLHASDNTPYGRRVRIVLAELGLDCERDKRPASQRDPGSYGALNPALRVPVLEDDGLALHESRLICEYLLATHFRRPPDAPRPPLGSTLTRPTHHWEDSLRLATLEALLEAIVNREQIQRGGTDPASVPYLERHAARVQSCLRALDADAGPEGFAPGLFTVADLTLICALDFGERHGVLDRKDYPGLDALAAAFADRPSVAGTRPAA